MNQHEAKRMACRITSGLIERYLLLDGVLDGDGALSEADLGRLQVALEDLQDEMEDRSRGNSRGP